MKISYDEAAEYLKGCSDVLIIMHANPDGDTLGSGFGLCRALRGAGIRANAVCSDNVPLKYEFMAEWYEPQEFEPKTVITVDTADTKLMGDYADEYGTKTDLCIDHHISNTGYAERLLLGENSAAACETVYKLLKKAALTIDAVTAMCLYTGIATDTGCFKFESVTPETHIIAAELCEYKFPLPFGKLNRRLFDIKSPSRIKAEAIIHKNMELFFDGKCAVTYITLEEAKAEDIKEEDFDGTAAIPMQIDGVEIAVTIREKEMGSFKISVRTEAAGADASAICANFGGGGHRRAAGCRMAGVLDDIKRHLVEVCEEHISGGTENE